MSLLLNWFLLLLLLAGIFLPPGVNYVTNSFTLCELVELCKVQDVESCCKYERLRLVRGGARRTGYYATNHFVKRKANALRAEDSALVPKFITRWYCFG